MFEHPLVIRLPSQPAINEKQQPKNNARRKQSGENTTLEDADVAFHQLTIRDVAVIDVIDADQVRVTIRIFMESGTKQKNSPAARLSNLCRALIIKPNKG